MYSQESKNILNEATNLAVAQGHEFLNPEHILIKLLEKPEIIEMFAELEIDRNFLIQKIQDELKKDFYPKLKESAIPKTTPSLERLFQHLYTYQLSFPKKFSDSMLLFYSFYFIPDTAAYLLILEEGLTKDMFINYLNHPKEKTTQIADQDPSTKSFLINLNEKMLKNKSIDPIIGRDNEIDRTVQILLRKKKNNPLLVGEPGVGKTAIAEGLAKKIVSNEIHESLKNHIVYSLDLGGLMAGTKFRGEFEERLKKVLAKFKTNSNGILFIDEIHTIVGAGNSPGGLDVSNLLKPALASGEIKCIGATTFKEYKNYFEKDGALNRRFQKIDIEEPSLVDSKKILLGLKPYYENYHGIVYEPGTIDLAVDLSAKYINDRFLPDKAIDILDEAGSLCKFEKKDKVSKEIIEKVLAKIAKIPERQLISSEKTKVKHLHKNLELSIFGQEEAVSTIVNSILLNKSGLRESNKPIGSFLFCGPTGVGKTELAKQLAINLDINFLRIDMSEYMEKFNLSKLIGAPPGYVGFDQEGVLTGSVLKHPHSVILLDEIEKSHSDIWNILLQIMDNGFLTDNYGKKIDFRNVILIMTSNTGSAEIVEKTISLTATENIVKKPTKSIEMTFSPEFRNRLDAIIWFNSLNKKDILDVLDKNLAKLDSLLIEKNICINYSNDVKDWLSTNGYVPSMGARPMAKLIEDKIKAPLSKEILFGDLEKGGNVLVNLEDGKIVFKIEKRKKQIKHS